MAVNEVPGVIARARGAPVELVPILVPDPGPGEALVRVQACGVCHTDLHYREGAINDEFPFLLGHEAAGIVEKTGAGVTPSPPAISSSWRGAPPVATAVPAGAAAPGTASPAATPPRK